jgi:hypothetical protein
MTTNADNKTSRRSAVVLAAAVAATSITAVAAVGGLRHWQASPPASGVPVVQPAAVFAPAAAPAPEPEES